VLARIAFATLLVAGLVANATGHAYAQDGEPGGGGTGFAFVDAVYAIAKAFIKVLIASSVAVFAASIARGTWSAQLANLVGSPMGMSQSWMNILGAVITFALAMLSPQIVEMVFSVIQGFVTTITIPTLSIQ
jgi:hypothetical protein